MSWFASTLETSCQTDLANQVETAVMTLNGKYHIDQEPVVSPDPLFSCIFTEWQLCMRMT